MKTNDKSNEVQVSIDAIFLWFYLIKLQYNKEVMSAIEWITQY